VATYPLDPLLLTSVLVADCLNHRVQVLGLVLAEDACGSTTSSSAARLDFHCTIGSGQGSDEGQLNYPVGIALLPGIGECEWGTV
jgi:hypothetical protein